MIRTRLMERLGLSAPIIQAPMAGGPTTPEMVAAVSNAGALGSFAAPLLSPAQLAAGVAAIRARTNAAFAVNLFVLKPAAPLAADVQAAIDRLAPLYAALGLPPPKDPGRYSEDFEDQFAAVLAARPPVFSFTFDALGRDKVRALKDAGTFVIGTANTVAEARHLEADGVDAVVAQGFEAGGHRGAFLKPPEESLVGVMALVPQVVDAVRVPVIAAGGIMDARGIAAALALGADAAQMGTAFIACPESGAPDPHKAALARGQDATALTRGISGRFARGVRNEFIDRMATEQMDVPAYPVQNALTGPLRAAAAAANRPEFMSLWAGQAAALSSGKPAARLVEELTRDTAALLHRLGR